MPDRPKSRKTPVSDRERLKALQETPAQKKPGARKVAPPGARYGQNPATARRDSPPKKKVIKPMPGIRRNELSDDQRWNNICAALAEDVLLDETPPGSSEDVDRIRKRIAQITRQHIDAKQKSDQKALEDRALQLWQERESHDRREIQDQRKSGDGARPTRKV